MHMIIVFGTLHGILLDIYYAGILILPFCYALSNTFLWRDFCGSCLTVYVKFYSFASVHFHGEISESENTNLQIL